MNRILSSLFILGCVVALTYSLPVEEDEAKKGVVPAVANPVAAAYQDKLPEGVALTDETDDEETDRQKRQFFGGYGGYGGYGGGYGRRFGGFGGGYGGYGGGYGFRRRGFGGYGFYGR